MEKIKEIEDFFDGWRDHWEGFAVNPDGEVITVDEIKEIAYHFYELGMKVKNEKSEEWTSLFFHK